MSGPHTWTVPALAAGASGALEQSGVLLGKDLWWSDGLVVTAGGDYQTVEGLEALRQSIYRRLLTRPGDYRARPDYGVGALSFVKRRRRASELDQLKVKIVDQLSLDPRISEVAAVDIASIEGGVSVSISVRAGGETLTFRPFNFTEQTMIWR